MAQAARDKALKRREIALTRLRETHEIGRIAQGGEAGSWERFQVYVARLDEVYASFEDANESVISVKEEDIQDDELKRKEADALYYGTRLIVASMTRDRAQSEVKVEEGSRSSLRLPPITLPSFSGDFKTWPGFYDVFQTLVHHNKSLATVEKFQYLLAALQGEPRSLLKSFTVAEANYEAAYATLVERYQNKRKLAFCYWETILNSSGKSGQAKELRALLDTFVENVTLLGNLGFETQNWDFILFHTLLMKLPIGLRQNFERTCVRDDIPSYLQLMDFLKTECISLELSTDSIKKSNAKRDAKLSLIAADATGSPRVCSCCTGQHFLAQCKNFLGMSVDKRYQFVKRNRLCFLCLFTGHGVRGCKQGGCSTCQGRHHVLLHPDRKTENGSGEGSNPVTVLTNSAVSSSMVMLATVQVDVRCGNRAYLTLRGVLDSGSQSSFITSRACQRLGLKTRATQLKVTGLGNMPAMATREVVCEIRSRYGGGESFVLPAFVIEKICGVVPARQVNTTTWSHLAGLTLSDPRCASPGGIDLLLGADVFGQVLTGQRREGPVGTPVAIETVFGWCLLGRTLGQDSPSDRIVLHATVEPRLDVLVQKFWQLDHFPNEGGPKGTKDLEVEQLFRDTCVRTPEGRFTVALPFRKEETNPCFEKSRELAVRRFASLERRFVRNPELADAYRQSIQEYIDSGHMSPVADEGGGAYYIPHHPVLKDSQTTKLRVVFDASARDVRGVSLNDCLEMGPPLQRPIFAILVRFRLRRIGFIADMKQMYRQIWVRPEDRRFQRILWRSQPDQPLQEYELNTVTFGVTSSPYLALRCLQELARTGRERYPRAAEALLSDVYMDDVVSGESDIGKAGSLQHELISLLHEGGLELRKWACNEPALLENLDSDVDHQLAVSLDPGDDSSIKVLGMRWSPLEDVFSYGFHVQERECTKRSLLSDLARVFDPLGLVSPIVFLAKYWMQCLWGLQLSWDDKVPLELATSWTRWLSELSDLGQLRIPRFVASPYDEIQIHGFCDASERGYAAAVYLRRVGGPVAECNLLIAKTRVSPLKRRSIPRLELCAAVLLSDLLVEVKREGGAVLRDSEMYAWTDSTIVIAWVSSSSSVYKPFIGNRVAHVQETVGAQCFRHVPTALNPADIASRGVFPAHLPTLSLWWFGPPFLREGGDSNWPSLPNLPAVTQEADELRSVALVTISEENIFAKFSKLQVLVAVVAWIFRFSFNCLARFRSCDPRTGKLSSMELRSALFSLVHIMQAEVFKKQLEQINQGKRLAPAFRALNLFVDSQGVLRVGGRLREADLAYQSKYPALLPRNHVLTNLIVKDYHERYLHPGLQTLHFLLRQNFWIMSPRRVIRQCVGQCVKCFRANPKPVQPFMGDLPASRIQEAKAFTRVGVDFGGPFYVRPMPGRGRGKQPHKMYVCLFVCQSTKAIHLELVWDLTAGAFVAALRRFVARRGHCSHINCDNGTNFVGGARILAQLLRQASDATCIKFEFNPARSPHFGGLFEAGIKSVKTHLHRVIGTQSLTIEEFLTFLAQVEALLNSRPLWAVSTDVRDLSALTPGHFLLLDPLSVLPDPDVTGKPLNTLSRWQLIQRLQQSFWLRWRNEYLHTLNQRQKWTDEGAQLLEGALVVIREENVKPLSWELARIVKLHPGKDGRARVATVRSARGSFQRPVCALCPLPNAGVSNG